MAAVDSSVPAQIEIERKFVLAAAPPGIEQHPSERIQQGYLAIAADGVEVRVRRQGRTAALTVKSAPGEIRVEEEIAIDSRRFEALWPLTQGRRVSKTRYLVALGAHTVELDVYDDALAGLVTAEIEFSSHALSADFVAPPWLGREVTGDARYANRTLATDGAP